MMCIYLGHPSIVQRAENIEEIYVITGGEKMFLRQKCFLINVIFSARLFWYTKSFHDMLWDSTVVMSLWIFFNRTLFWKFQEHKTFAWYVMKKFNIIYERSPLCSQNKCFLYECKFSWMIHNRNKSISMGEKINLPCQQIVSIFPKGSKSNSKIYGSLFLESQSRVK